MKKFLSLVLALVMTMSLVTVGAGAADFTDDSSITYEEAVDVMTAIGVVGGYPDGSFGPKGTLTRGAAAKIICNLILGTTTADALVADSAPYADVPVDNVFAGYIAYLAKAGVIGGYADGTFRPAATLTGYAFMKMLLGVIGLDASIEGYTGANWSISVAKRALSDGVDLTDGLVGEFNGTKAVTREEACLYAFNAIKAVKFNYSNKSTLVVGDITVSSTSEAKQDDAEKNYANAYFKSVFSKLSYVPSKSDDFGRPAHQWKYDDDKIGTYTDTADYVLVLDSNYKNTDFSNGDSDIVKELQELADNDDLNYDGKTELYVNGTETKTADALAYANKGTVVELFCGKNDYIETVVVLKGKLVKIKDVTTKISGTAEKKGAEYAIKLDEMGTYYDAYDKDDSKVLVGFDADTYVEDAYIVVFEKKGDSKHTILDSYVAEAVKGKADSYKEDNYVKLDGTKYSCAGDVETGKGVKTGTLDFDKEYTLYLDANGYIMKVDGDTATSISDVYYVTGVYKTTTKGTTTYYAETVALDGTTADLVLSEKSSLVSALNNKVDNEFVKTAGLYTLTLNSDDEYGSKAFDSKDADYDVYGIDSLTESVKKDASSLKLTGKKVYMDEETNQLSVKVKNSGLVKTVKTAVGGMSMTSGVKAYAITKEGKNDALYVLYVGTGVAAAVDTDDVVFVAEKSSEKDSKDTYLTDIWYMKDNTDDTISVKGQEDVAFYTYSINDDDQYELDTVDALTGEVKDDVSGWATINFVKADVHESTVSFNYGTTPAATKPQMEDIDFSNANVIDLRDEDDVDDGVYKYDRTITSVSDLKDAIDEAGKVHAYIYINDGEIIFVAVTASTDNK